MTIKLELIIKIWQFEKKIQYLLNLGHFLMKNIGWNYIFQVKIWQKFTNKRNTVKIINNVKPFSISPTRLEWINNLHCTNLGWGCSSRFGDEPKTHPLPLPRDFSAPSFASKLSPPTNLPSLLPPSTHLPLILSPKLERAPELE